MDDKQTEINCEAIIQYYLRQDKGIGFTHALVNGAVNSNAYIITYHGGRNEEYKGCARRTLDFFNPDLRNQLAGLVAPVLMEKEVINEVFMYLRYKISEAKVNTYRNKE